MNFLRNLQISQQLRLLSTIALVGIVAMTAISWVKVGTVFESASYANKNTLPSLVTLGVADTAATTVRVRNWQVVALTDTTQRQGALAKRDEALDALTKALDKYESENMISDTSSQRVEDDRLLATARATVADLLSVSNQAKDLVTAGHESEAASLLYNNAAKLQGLSDAIGALIDTNIKWANEAAVEAEAVTRNMVIMLLVIGGVLTLLSLSVSHVISRNVRGGVGQALQVAEKIAQGQLGQTIDSDAHGEATEIGRLLRALQTMDHKLSEIVGSVSSTAELVGSAARQISQGNDDLSSRTQEQASALEETAATMEQMTAAVKRNADNARQADQLGRQARNQADTSSEVVERTVAAMDEINTASRKIGDIINVIDEIAFQTNLLALNAAVEAARAGEQGRGFAVVASEVRNLAQRSASAAKEIKSLIQDSMHKVQSGTELVNTSGKVLNDIVTDVKRVTDIVAEIAAATAEQANGIDQINHAVTQMDTTTQQNAALVEEAASASKSMEDQTQTLLERIGFFRVAGQAHHSLSRPVSSQRPQQTVSQPVSVTSRQRSTAQSGASFGSAPALKKAVGDEQSWTEF